MTAPWVADPTWSLLLQRDAMHRTARTALTVRCTPGLLSYHHAGVEVVGRADPVPVTVEFHRIPPYYCYGLAPEEYPRVLADLGASSPHRMPEDDRLCLWMPQDPPEQRWTPDDGLQRLLEITAEHLFAEQYWRATGGIDENGVEVGQWPIPQADHGGAVIGAAAGPRCSPSAIAPGGISTNTPAPTEGSALT